MLTEAAHRVDEAADLDHDERQALRTDIDRVREVLTANGVAANGTRAVAVFACESADLLEVVSLRHPLASRVVLDDAPYVEPLVHVGAAERWCVLLANRRAARLFVGDGDELEETDRIEDDVHRRHDQGGWSQANYQRSIDKEVEDHLAHTAEVAFELYKRRGFDRLLVGTPDELVADLEAKLHPYLRERLAGHVSCDVEHSSLDAVRRCAGERIEEHARAAEREALDRLAQGVGSGDRGAAGLAAVLAALNEARVEVLLVARGHVRGRASATPPRGCSTRRPEDVPDGATATPVADVVEKAIEKAIEQSADVIGIRHHDDLGPLGGIGAILRLLMRVAVLGTGIMGAPMARNLAAAGHEVRAWNRSRERAEPLAADGVEVADSAAEAVRDADVVVTMLADGAAVEAVAADLEFPDGAVWAQMSTVGIEATDRLVARAAEAGVADRRRAGARHEGAGRAGQADRDRRRAAGGARALRAGVRRGRRPHRRARRRAGRRHAHEARAQRLAAGADRGPLGVRRAGREPRPGPGGVPGDHRRRPARPAVREDEGHDDDRAVLRAELLARARRQGRPARARSGRVPQGLELPALRAILGQLEKAVEQGHGDDDMAAAVEASRL